MMIVHMVLAITSNMLTIVTSITIIPRTIEGSEPPSPTVGGRPKPSV